MIVCLLACVSRILDWLHGMVPVSWRGVGGVPRAICEYYCQACKRV